MRTRTLSTRSVLLVAAVMPMLGLLALGVDLSVLPALKPIALPVTFADIAISAIPLLACALCDRKRRVRIALGFLCGLCLASNAFMCVVVAGELYRPDIETMRVGLHVYVLTFASVGIALGARSSRVESGVATAICLALYVLPPALSYVAQELSGVSTAFLQVASPQWSFNAMAGLPWGYLVLGIAGWLLAFRLECCVVQRMRRHQ